MKLYVYDHCPFCIRARMPFGLKAIPFDLAFLANDDEAGPISMIGVKMLPILEDADGFMGESLDIVAKVDGVAGPRLFDGAPREAIKAWLGTWIDTANTLVIPRTPDPIFPEFRTESARAYFTAAKEKTFGDFTALLAATDTARGKIEAGLADLVPILPDHESATIDDILLFPILRGLTIVPDLKMPDPVATYVRRMSERCGVPLVTELQAAAAQ
ncbi:glutaredoxin 2 [Acuticoccus sp. M5D2P5]|uniref:glutaredoxin 2 n=1 Tax=Acuticoccus kalidii TaxID=2910977 RepID=UPI001F20EA33|nr:glutaredoxin 2 [Acuticoccus kalidii]MCF3933702.1 glutaredoxin 2 [Acuticoccus kalidii]